MNKHTPGPWRVVEDRVPASLEVYSGKTAIAECWRRAETETELANARLIAAAPELLDALQYLANVCPAINAQGEEAHQRASAAVAKAVGA